MNIIEKNESDGDKQMVGESCKEVIQGKKHRLTNTELKLADYILEHYDEALNYNVTELADSAG